ncbi:MAG: Teichoic acids export ATP-binding protein TagH [Candidatus Hydrogenedentes bacterium ADurb.Bin179]|nr:MAG: Teichoic acids export ATP-binding protein TagH [Candidatus Hydrogenedentes bacterium ADurb.Bin179]
MAPIVQVEHVYKKYSRNANAHLSYGMRDLYNHLLGRQPSLELRKDEFFAVNDVSFRLERGDTLALIGRNGSGKSTMLKMMNGLIKLDAGRIVMDGRVQALINLGAGFNGALSGMDNIYNSAALYGFSRKQTKSIVDEIVDFAELDEFINSPVETYSSGMKARLGFAVAVHLKPDILLIDEILAVGDAAFRNKCYARMEALKKRDVTIVFVSHTQSAVIKLCKDALWLHKGRIMAIGPSMGVVETYNGYLEAEEKEKLARDQAKGTPVSNKPLEKEPEKRPKESKSSGENSLYGPVHSGNDHVEDVRCTLVVDGQETSAIKLHSALRVRVSFKLKTQVEHLYSTLNFHRKDGLLLAAIATSTDDRFGHIHDGRIFYEVRIPDLDFAPGHYVIMMPIADGQHYLWRDIVKEFFVESGGRICYGVTEITHEYTVRVEED